MKAPTHWTAKCPGCNRSIRLPLTYEGDTTVSIGVDTAPMKAHAAKCPAIKRTDQTGKVIDT